MPDTAIHVIGRLVVRRRGRILSAAEVGSRKARTLLALLAVAPGPLMPVDRLVDVLWDGDPPPGARRNVATLVSRLRATLGRTVVAGRSAGYRLGDDVRVDLDDGARLVADAEGALAAGAPRSALTAARTATTLLGSGGVLDDRPGARWADPARARLAAQLCRARHAAAEAGLAAGDPWAARSAAEAAVAADIFDEAAWRALMRAYTASGEPLRALGAYERLRAALVTELGVDPAARTRELYQTIQRARAACRVDRL